MAENFADAILESFTAYDSYKNNPGHDQLMEFLHKFDMARQLFKQRQWRKYINPDGIVYMRPIPSGEE